MFDPLIQHIKWRAIPPAGAAAGTGFLLVNLIGTPLTVDLSAMMVLRYFGSLVLGSDVLTESSGVTTLVGVLTHYALAMLFTLLIVIVLHRWGMLVGIVGGATLGVAIYLINLYSMTYFFEWFWALNNTVLFISHAVFGAIAGGVYEMLDDYDQPFDVGGGA